MVFTHNIITRSALYLTMDTSPIVRTHTFIPTDKIHTRRGIHAGIWITLVDVMITLFPFPSNITFTDKTIGDHRTLTVGTTWIIIAERRLVLASITSIPINTLTESNHALNTITTVETRRCSACGDVLFTTIPHIASLTYTVDTRHVRGLVVT
jgi:hypothetical protein